MGGNPLQSYAPLLIHLLAALLLSGALVAVSSLFGYRMPSLVNFKQYE
jgi:hypothetical protein